MLELTFAVHGYSMYKEHFSNHLFVVELSMSLRCVIQHDTLRFAKARQDQEGLTLVGSVVSARDPPVLEFKPC